MRGPIPAFALIAAFCVASPSFGGITVLSYDTQAQTNGERYANYTGGGAG
jgi:hypothetical protein